VRRRGIALRNEKKNADKLVAKVPKSLQRDAGLIYERARWRRRKEKLCRDPRPVLSAPQVVARPDMMWRELDDAARRALARGQVKVAYKLAIQHGADDGTTFAEGEWLSGGSRSASCTSQDGLYALHAPPWRGRLAHQQGAGRLLGGPRRPNT